MKRFLSCIQLFGVMLLKNERLIGLRQYIKVSIPILDAPFVCLSLEWNSGDELYRILRIGAFQVKYDLRSPHIHANRHAGNKVRHTFLSHRLFLASEL